MNWFIYSTVATVMKQTFCCCIFIYSYATMKWWSLLLTALSYRSLLSSSNMSDVILFSHCKTANNNKIEANHHCPAWEIREVCSRSHRDSDAVLWHIWAPAVRLFVHLTIQTVWCGKLTRNEYKLENVSRFSRNAVRTQMSVSERCSFTDFFIKQHKAAAAAVDWWILWNANYVSLCSLFV